MNAIKAEISRYKSSIIKAAFQAPKASGKQPVPTEIFDKALAKIKLHEKQQHIIDTALRFNVPCCGRRFGKTTLTDSLVLPIAKTGLPVCYFQPVYNMLIEELRNMTIRQYDLIEDYNLTDKWILFKGGSKLDFFSYEAYDNIRGRKYKRAILDEVAFEKTHKRIKNCWEQSVRPTLIDYRGDAFFLSTPRLGYYQTLFENELSDKDWKSWRFTSYDNPHLDPHELESLQKDMTELVRMQEIEAQFVEMGGTLIKKEYLRTALPPSGLQYYMGVDLAISTKSTADYTAIAILARDDEGNIYICDVQRARKAFHDSMTWILEYAAKWDVEEILVEQTQYQAAAVQELLLRSTFTVRGIRPKKDKVTRFMGMQARYEQGLVYHSPYIIEEYEKELLSFPVGEHDDMIDAVSYAYQGLPTL